MSNEVQKLSEVENVLSKLPEDLQKNVKELIEDINYVVEGIGGTPSYWRPTASKLIQSNTDRDTVPEKASIGTLLIGEKVFGKEGLQAFPLSFHYQRVMWDPNLDNKGSILCRSADSKVGDRFGECSKCSFAQYDEQANKVDCTKVLVATFISKDLRDIFQTTYSKTSYSYGKRLVDQLKKTRRPIYSRLVSLKPIKNPKVTKTQVFCLDSSIVFEESETPTEEVKDLLKHLQAEILTSHSAQIESWVNYIDSKGKGEEASSADKQIPGGLVLEHEEDTTVPSDGAGYII